MFSSLAVQHITLAPAPATVTVLPGAQHFHHPAIIASPFQNVAAAYPQVRMRSQSQHRPLGRPTSKAFQPTMVVDGGSKEYFAQPQSQQQPTPPSQHSRLPARSQPLIAPRPKQLSHQRIAPKTLPEEAKRMLSPERPIMPKQAPAIAGGGAGPIEKQVMDQRPFGSFSRGSSMRKQEKKVGNRAAAKRCRLKKKQYVESLEKRAQELVEMNEKLQKELAALQGNPHTSSL